jgi:4-amino-4-deoxy-L-arabinose transferase-like glycosyltransferase
MNAEEMPARKPGAMPEIGRWFVWVVAVLIAVLFAARNLPWHLDDYDQAKQAFTSFEMIEEGHWWFQHTPTGRIATKPPLSGWFSAVLQYAMPWEFAWRVPSFASAVLITIMLWRRGTATLRNVTGGVIAASAFALNVFSPRLATLVRTDMLLTLFIFLAGCLILDRVGRVKPWTWRTRMAFCLAILGSMLTKGPIVYAFLLPGLAVYAVCVRRWRAPNDASSGFWPWLLPLAVFAGWVCIGIQLSPDFYDQVVRKEFFGRFDMSDAPVHKHQPIYFYAGHLLLRFAPWSLCLAALFSLRSVRAALRTDRALLWLVCWSTGGLMVMSIVPSKRFDRILPVVPPLCLLLVAALRHAPTVIAQTKFKRAVRAIVLLAACISLGYAGVNVWQDTTTNQRGLVHFGERARAIVDNHGGRLAVVSGKDEGMLLYTRTAHFTRLGDALDQWKTGEINWLIAPARDLDSHAAELAPVSAIRVLESGKIKGKSSDYILLQRSSPRSF